MCFLWKNFSILNWRHERPLLLLIFSRHKNFSIVMTCPTICLQAPGCIPERPFDEGWDKDRRQAWKTIVHATPPSDSWKTIDCVKWISSFSLLPWYELFSFLFLSFSLPPACFCFCFCFGCCRAFHYGRTHICVNIKYISHIFPPLTYMPFFFAGVPKMLSIVTYNFNRILWMWHTRLHYVGNIKSPLKVISTLLPLPDLRFRWDSHLQFPEISPKEST